MTEIGNSAKDTWIAEFIIRLVNFLLLTQMVDCLEIKFNPCLEGLSIKQLSSFQQ